MTRTTAVLSICTVSILLSLCSGVRGAFVPSPSNFARIKPTAPFDDRNYRPATPTPPTTLVPRNLFDLTKIFEESGSLGKGITVGKVQVALTTSDRTPSSIMGILAETARNSSNDSPSLAKLSEEVCLALLRRSDDWVGACSDSKWFGGKDEGKAESQFNDWTNREAAKFEKEYVPEAGSDDKAGGPTTVVVSLIVEIQGDTTKFDGAGFSLAGTRDVLSSISSDCRVDQGYCLNAAEVFWTPSDFEEVLTTRDVVYDFPEIIDF